MPISNKEGKAYGGPGVLPWSVKGRGEGLRERGNHRIESVGFPSPLNFAAFLKAQFPLLSKGKNKIPP